MTRVASNSTGWSIFAPGEALFLGGEGGEDEQNWVDVTYHIRGATQ